MTSIELHVTSISQERIDVSIFGDPEPRSVDGPITVEFRSASGDRFDIDWTQRTDPLPKVGSTWHLNPQENQ